MNITIDTMNMTINIVGKEAQKELPDIIKNVTELSKETVAAGSFKRPSVTDLHDRSEPQEVKDAKAAIKESLDKIPELQAHKKAVEEFKRDKRGIL